MKQRGFTLIELAIVLVLVTILIGGLAMPLSAQIQARRIAETKKTLEEAREAVLGFAMTHPIGATGKLHLPCPDISNDGLEDRGLGGPEAECAAPSGLLPWVTLGAAAQDAWGNRLRYAVNAGEPSFAHSSAGFSTSTALVGALEICTTHTCATPVASDVVFVLLSDGPNSRGARNVNLPLGTATPSAPPDTGTNELENQDGDIRYVSSSPYKPADSSAIEAAKEFDDLVVWISRAHLIARVCPTGCLPP